MPRTASPAKAVLGLNDDSTPDLSHEVKPSLNPRQQYNKKAKKKNYACYIAVLWNALYPEFNNRYIKTLHQISAVLVHQYIRCPYCFEQH